MQYKNPANKSLVMEGLRRAGREDLIGYGPKCLIRPDRDNLKHAGKGKSDGRTETGRKAAHGKKKTIRNIHRKKQK